MGIEATFAEALNVFIADCMSVAGKIECKATAIREMASRANNIFKNHQKTPERVREVKGVISMMVA